MKNIVSIEVCNDAIRAAEVTGPLSKNPKVVKIGEIELESGIAGESVIHNIEAFSEKLKELWNKEKFSTKNIAIVVGGRRFIVREHETGQVNMKDLRNVIRFEATNVIPPNMSEPIVDFYPTHAANSKSGVRTFGLVIATPAEPIETIVNTVVSAGFKVEFVDFAPMSIARYIRNQIDPKSSYVLANIREDSTDIVIAKNGVPRIVRVTSIGLEPQKRQIGRHAADESSIISYNASTFSKDSPISKLAASINMTTQTAMEELDISIDTLFLSGPRSGDSELVRTLEDLLKTNVVPLHTTPSVSVNTEFDDALSASDFVAICGGMRGKL